MHGHHHLIPYQGLENLDSIEGSRDSEDPNISATPDVNLKDGISSCTSAGESFGFGNFTLYTSGASSLSGMKRKRDGSRTKKGGQTNTTKKIKCLP